MGDSERKDDAKVVIPTYTSDSPDFVLDLRPNELSRQFQVLHHSFGLSSDKRYNLHYIDFGVLLFASGNTVQLFDTHTNKKTVILGKGASSNSAIGAVAVHPDKTVFAVAEKGANPKVIIYAYIQGGPYKIINVLREGTTSKYADLMFSADGTQLATVGGYPDYLLSVWDWATERIILKTKAFSQDVFHVQFSPFYPGSLATSGSGHIKFWKMASTFTGLKLQGSVGKFGTVELSDIAAFAFMPDGKVLSGSESGNLLMWDGNFIQYEIMKADRSPCHRGNIEYISFSPEDRTIISAGADGYMRTWDYNKLEFADPSETCFPLDPVMEVQISENTGIKCLLRESDQNGPHWVAIDTAGALYKIVEVLLPGEDEESKKSTSFEVQQILDFHSQGISGLAATFAEGYLVATSGLDGTVRMWDVANPGVGVNGLPGCLYKRQFNQPATCLIWLDRGVDFESRSLLVGFADGVVRLLRRYDDHFKLIIALKPHNTSVVSMAITADGSVLATLGKNGDIFFLAVQDGGRSYDPLGYAVPPSPPRAFVFSDDSRRVLLACGNCVIEYTVPRPGSFPDAKNRDSYRLNPDDLNQKILTLAIPPEPALEVEEKDENSSDEEHENDKGEKTEKRDKKDKKKEEVKSTPKNVRPDEISAILYSPSGDGSFFVTLDGGLDASGQFAAFPGARYERIYQFTLASGVPKSQFSIGANSGSVTSLGLTASRAYLLVGLRNGCVQVRPVAKMNYFMEFNYHDAEYGGVSACCTSQDDRFVLSVGRDGNFFAAMCDIESAIKAKQQVESVLEEKRTALQAKADFDLRRAADVWQREYNNGMKKLQKTSDDNKTPMPKDEVAALEKLKRQNERRDRIKARENLKVIDREVGILERGMGPRDQVIIQAPEFTLMKLGATDPVIEASDIKEKSVYSIEENKLKQEEDHHVAAGNEKKERMRKQIAQLREEFKAILAKNASLPPSQQLPREAFELDPKLRQHIEAETQQQIETVRAELAWLSEKYTIALEKLRTKYLSKLIVEHIRMKAFKLNISVSSYRTAELPQFLKAAMDAVSKMLDTEERAPQQLDDLNATQTLGGAAADGEAKAASSTVARREKAGADRDHTQSKKKLDHASEAERRKQEREERKKEMEALLASKPDKGVDDPADLAEIQRAQKNMGDYKLKSAKDYVVPPHMRMNVEKKRRQMAMVQQSIQSIMMAHNERFLSVRDLKRRIIENIKRDNVRLRELNKLLGITETLFEPELNPAEWPEHRDKFTAEDIKAFELQQAREEEAARRKAQAGGLFANSKSKGDEKAKDAPDAKDSKEAKGAKESQDSKDAKNVAQNLPEWKQRLAKVPKSDLEKAEDRVRVRLWEHERSSLLAKINNAVAEFDNTIERLRREKFKQDSDLKTADLRVLTLFQELQLLKSFEDKENALFGNLNKFRAAKSQVVTECADFERQLARKLAEIKLWKEKDVQVLTEFQQAVGGEKHGEKSEHYHQLFKIFKKKLKRGKKKVRDDDDEGDSDDDEEGGSEEGSGDESDSNAEDDDQCPPGCETSVYEKVLELRERRLEQEEILADFVKMSKELERSYNRSQENERKINSDLQRTEDEIEQFQTQKQRALNSIRVTIPLKLHQLKYLVNGRLPEDISNALIFTSTGLDKLRERIVFLGNQKLALREQFKQRKKEHKALKKELKDKKLQIDEEKKKCEDVQMLKFGQIIDMSILEKVKEDESAKVLRDRLQALEASSVQRVSEWDQKIQGARDELARITQENTQWLERVAQLTKAQYDLEHQLNATTKNVHIADTRPSDEKENSERRQLLGLVQVQEREIDALKAEIHVLRRKGGHVYTPQ